MMSRVSNNESRQWKGDLRTHPWKVEEIKMTLVTSQPHSLDEAGGVLDKVETLGRCPSFFRLVSAHDSLLILTRSRRSNNY